ncbi:ABC transporter permease [Pararobbsia silviterrae]|uniref:Autoinducer 2 import system permease protein LsrD n=1 Tax=Pararobbsia silviterrae TaxID=1792498 RepID=A0A494XUC6_9BURK|nr:ABC transporter permease [Pararobbsia silviterrae]RKP53291.1 ABC transporter permease [Pararobbsia silviterrae]
MNSEAFNKWIGPRPWVWSFVGLALVWLTTVAVTHGNGSVGLLATAIQFGTFYVLVGLGQMLVISCGSGNIDLSVSGSMTLAAFVGLSVSAQIGGPAGAMAGIVVALVIGALAGLANALLIQRLRVPPMIATLAAGFVLQSFSIAYSHGASPAPSIWLRGLVATKWAGIPAISVATMVLSFVIAQALRRTILGRTVLATGQNQRAAVLAGLKVKRAVATSYVMCGIFSAAAGLLLASFVGGATLDIGQDYLLMSIACVVLGGTAVSGGFATTVGVWGGGLLLVLAVTMLNVMQVGPSMRFVVTGLVIIGVLAVAKPQRAAS